MKRQLKKGLALLLTLAIVLTFGGISGLVNAAIPVGFDEDWSDRFEVVVRVGSGTGDLLKDGDTISLKDTLHVEGTITLPQKVADGAILGGSNITNNYAGKKFYLGTVTDLFKLNGYKIEIFDESDTVCYGTATIDNGAIYFEFDSSTEPGHIACAEYEDEILGNIVFSYAAAFRDDVKDTLNAETEICFADKPSGKFSVKIDEIQPKPVEVEKNNVTYSIENKEATWSIKLTNRGQDNGGDVFSVTDIYDPAIPLIEGTLTADKGTISDVNVDTDNNKFTFTYTADADFNGKTAENKTRVITYKTKLNINTAAYLGLEGEKAQVITNYADVKNVTKGDEFPRKEATIEVKGDPKELITKSGNGDVSIDDDADTATAGWTINVKTFNMFSRMMNARVEDKLQKPIKYVPGTLEITVGGKTVNYAEATGEDISFGPKTGESSNYSFASIDLKKVATLAGVDADESNVDFTIKYKTVLENYTNYVTTFKNQSVALGNSARFLFDIEDYRGPGTGVAPVATGWADKTQKFVRAGITKDVTAKSIEEGSVTWKVVVEPTTSGNISVVDFLPDGMKFDPERAELSVKKIAAGGTTEQDIENDEYVVTANVAPGASTSDKFTFKIVKDGDEANLLTDKIVIRFKTFCTDPNFYAKNVKDKAFNNNVTLYYGDKAMTSARATAKLTSNVINKKAVTDTKKAPKGINYSENLINWSINVNENGMKMGTDAKPVKVVDYIPCGTKLDEESLTYTLKKYNKANDHSASTKVSTAKAADLNYTYTEPKGNTPGKLEIVLPSFTEMGYWGNLTYATKIDTDDSFWSKCFMEGKGAVEIKNEAILENEHEVTKAPAAEAGVKYEYSTVKKLGEIIDSETLQYGIALNSAKVLLPKGTAFKDQMSAGMNYKQRALELYVADVNTKGEVYKPKDATKLEKGKDYSVDFKTDESGSEYMIITFLRDIKDAIYFEYTVMVPDSNVAEEYTNSIYQGEKKFGNEGEVRFERSAIQKAKGSSTRGAAYRVELTKTATTDENALLEGAEYGIYSDESCTQLIESNKTNGFGKITFWDLDQNTTYYIKELKAPEGYKLDENVHQVNTLAKKTEAAVTDEEVLGEEFGNQKKDPGLNNGDNGETLGENSQVVKEELVSSSESSTEEVLNQEIVKAQTGDKNKITIFIILGLASICVIAGFFFLTKKK
ncbi:MAG: hypothetical protein E7241_04215 [Lachnospiraceae bacterium]|nr:hypothetical protein [Lachnospiraceae bacterium]